MSDGSMTEAEAVARFGRELAEVSARGRAPDSTGQVAAIVADNERACAALRRRRPEKIESPTANRR